MRISCSELELLHSGLNARMMFTKRACISKVQKTPYFFFFFLIKYSLSTALIVNVLKKQFSK